MAANNDSSSLSRQWWWLLVVTWSKQVAHASRASEKTRKVKPKGCQTV